MIYVMHASTPLETEVMSQGNMAWYDLKTTLKSHGALAYTHPCTSTQVWQQTNIHRHRERQRERQRKQIQEGYISSAQAHPKVCRILVLVWILIKVARELGRVLILIGVLVKIASKLGRILILVGILIKVACKLGGVLVLVGVLVKVARKLSRILILVGVVPKIPWRQYQSELIHRTANRIWPQDQQIVQSL